MTKDEALRLALEFIPSINPAFICEASHHKKHEQHASNEPCPHVAKQKQVYEAIKAALEAKDEIDWKDMYEKEKRHSEMWTAKYEKDIGPLEKAVPHQEAKDEPVAWISPTELLVMRGNALAGAKDWRVNVGLKPEDGDVGLYTTPKRTWVGLTDEELDDCYDNVEWNTVDWCPDHQQLARAVEAKLKEKNT